MADESTPRKHAVVSARVPAPIRELVRAAAAAKGYSISSYVASRIQQDALEDLTTAYGTEDDRVRAGT